MGNLFDKAKAKGSKSTKVNNDKLIVKIDSDEFDQSLVKMAELESQISQLTAELEIAKGVVKDTGVYTFENIYTKNGGYPGSFIMSSKSDASVMFIPMDKYIKCDEQRFNELKDIYGDDIVTEKTEYNINSALLDKYGEIISDLIENCNEISDDDKSELIQAKVSYSVSKGAIEKAFTWGKGMVSDFIRDIQPVFSLKSAKTK